MKSYSLLIGSHNARGRFVRKDENLLEEITARHFPGGFTILAADGRWYDPAAKTFRKEEARQILICTVSKKKLRRWCLELGLALRQKELLVIEVGKAFRFGMPGGRRVQGTDFP